jgi:predicted acetyltransferase
MPSFEIRAVRPEELDDFLGVLCAVYEMPVELAAPIFYADPYFDSENKRALFVEGRVVSALTLVDSQLWIGEAIVPFAGIAGVATLPDERRQGYASALIRDSLEVAAKRGYALAALQSDRLDYYRQFGFEVVSRQPIYNIDPGLLPQSDETTHVHPLTQEDLPAIAKIYTDWSHGRTGWATRDEKRWRYLYQLAKTCIVYQGANNQADGYLILDMVPSEAGYRLNVLEWVCATDTAHQALTGFLALQADTGQVQFSSGVDALTASGLSPSSIPEPDDAPMMACILDLPRALAAVTGENDLLDVQSSSNEDLRTWAQALVGYRSFDDIRATYEAFAELDRSDRLAQRLPERNPFLPPVDYF